MRGGARLATFDRPGSTVLLRGYDAGGRAATTLRRAQRSGEGGPESRDRSNRGLDVALQKQ